MHFLESREYNSSTKEKSKWDIKISFWFWAWSFIPISHYTGVNGPALLPQGQLKLFLVRKKFSSLHAVHLRSAEESKQRKTPADRGACLGASTAPGPFQSPSPCPGQNTASLCHPKCPARAGAARATHSSVGRRIWDQNSQQNCALSSWKAPREGFRADPSLFPEE